MTTALCMFALLPAHADPPASEMARDLGYSSELLDQKELPKTHFPRAPREKLRTGIETLTEGKVSADRQLLEPQVYQKAEPASMIPFLMTIQKKQPNSPKITRKLALTCLQAGQPREALYWFTQTWQRDRTDLPALWNMASLSYRLGDIRKTNDYLAEYAKRDPNTSWGMVARKFLETGTFGGYDAASTYESRGIPRIGFVAAGSSGSPEGGLMVVEGKRVDVDEMVSESNQLPGVNPFKPASVVAKKADKADKEDASKSDSEKSSRYKRASTNEAKAESTDSDRPKPASAGSPLSRAAIDTLPSKDQKPVPTEKTAVSASATAQPVASAAVPASGK